MSLGDITLNSKVYSVSSVVGPAVTRRCTAATLPSGVDSSELELSHNFGTGTKPDRHLAKVSRVITDANGKKQTISLHAVLTIPKGLETADLMSMVSGNDAIGDDLAALFTLDTFAFAGRLMNGEFS